MSDKRRTIVAPWKNIVEFQKVFDAIYNENTTAIMRRQALSQMRVWSCRRSVLCPAGVLATSVLLDVQLLDETQEHGESEMQTLYANAFMRFFNFMSSIMQTYNMRTMYETARHLGLDSFVVDMRHMCAHGQQLPPLNMLRRSVSYCMQWLGNYFWRSQLANMREVDARNVRRKDRTLVDDKFEELFTVYDAALESYVKGAHNMKTAKRCVHGRRYTALKSYFEEHKLTELRPIFDVLVQEFSELLRRECGMKDLAAIYVDALLGMRHFFTIPGGYIVNKLLELLIDVTQGLFRMLAVHNILEDLFYALLQHAENTLVDAARRAGAAFWAEQIVQGFVAFRKCKQVYRFDADGVKKSKSMDFDFSTTIPTMPSKKIQTLLKQSGVRARRTLILADSVRRPWVWLFERSFLQQHLEAINEYTAPVLKALLPLVEPALNSKESQLLQALIDALFESGSSDADDVTNTDKMNEDDGIYTAADLVQQLQEFTTSTKPLTTIRETFTLDPASDSDTTEQQCYGLWSTVPDDVVNNWTTCPLGKVPWV